MFRITLLLGLIFTSFPATGLDTYIVKTTEPFVMINGEIDDAPMIKVINAVTYLNKKLPKGVPIRIYLKSGGGIVTSGLALIETILLIRKSRPVYGIVVDRCSSMCYTILQSMSKRFMNVDSYLFEHKVRAANSTNEKPVYTESTRRLDRKRKSYNRFFTPVFLGDEYYLNEMDALKYNVIDKIVNIKCEIKLIRRGLCPLTLGD